MTNVNFSVPAPALYIIVYLHAFLGTLGSLVGYLNPGYWFSNFGLAVLGYAMLASHSNDAKLLQMYIVTLCFTIVNDCIALGCFSNDGTVFQSSGEAKFTFAMALLNVIAKPVSLIFLLVEYKSRGGNVSIPYVSTSGGSGGSGGNYGSTAYREPTYAADNSGAYQAIPDDTPQQQQPQPH